MWDFDYSQHLPSRMSPLFFFFFIWYIFLSLQVYEWPLFGYGYVVSHFGDPFGYGYAVNHSEPSALISLMGLYFIFFTYGLCIFFIYDILYFIFLTHTWTISNTMITWARHCNVTFNVCDGLYLLHPVRYFKSVNFINVVLGYI